MNPNRRSVLNTALISFVLALVATGCGLEGDGAAVSSEAPETVVSTESVSSTEYNSPSQPLTQAQIDLDDGLKFWQSLDAQDYTLTLTTGEDSRSRVIQVRDGVVTDDLAVDASGAQVAGETLGLVGSVDEVFAEVGSLAKAAATNPPATPGDCDGSHVYIAIDSDTGVPSSWHGLGPCAEGPGSNAEVEILS